MTTLRNAGGMPGRTRRIARVGQALGIAALLGGMASLTACSDAPLAGLSSPAGGPRLAASTTVGDTTFTNFRVGPSDDRMIVLSGDYKLKLDIPPGAICDPATSGYGPSLWDAPCAPATAAVEFTAKSWTDASGRPRLEITPDVRFVPGKVVTVYMKSQKAAESATSNILWCPTGGAACVDESQGDATAAPSRDANGGWISRRVKHFSGYNVVFGLDGFGSETMFNRAASRSGYITTTGFDGGDGSESLDNEK